MQTEIISDKQGIAITTVFTLGSVLVLGSGLQGKQDSWISIILAVILTIPIDMMYARILSLFPGNDIFDISRIVFGKITGKFFCILFILFAFFLATIVLRVLGLFINTMSLPETPQIIPMILLGLLCTIGVKEGVESLSRWSEFFLNFLLAYVIITFLLLINKMDIKNILPVMYNGVKPVLTGAISAMTYPFAETVVLLMVLPNLKTKKSPYKVFLWSLFISGIIVFIATFRSLLSLGPIAADFYFPPYVITGKINIGDFLQRLEILVALVLLLAGYMQIATSLLAACRGIAKLFECNDYRFIIWPVSLIMINYSYFILKNTMEMKTWALKIWMFYAVWFEIFLPLIIYIGAEIKAKMIKKNNNSGYI